MGRIIFAILLLGVVAYAGAFIWKTYFHKKSGTEMILGLLLSTFMFISCTTIEPGHEGVEVSWGGEVNLNKTFTPGLHWGLHWLWDDCITYDIREKTTVKKFEFNDKDNMKVPVEISADFKIISGKSNTIHNTIGKDQLEVKILTTLSSAAKQIIPQYSGTELNLQKREEAENKLLDILQRECPSFYVTCERLRITDVDIPEAIAQTAEANARQTELNKLAEKKKYEAENNFKAAEWDAKTKAILSQPAMLALKKLEVEQIWANKGVSPYGSGNVFGSDAIKLISK